MTPLLKPSGTLAIILGSQDWSRAGLDKAPSFRRSAAYFHKYLLMPPPDGLGLEPDLVLNLFDDPTPAGEQLTRIREAVEALLPERSAAGKPVEDILIYYVGHGSCNASKHLHLLVRDSRSGLEEDSSIGAPALARLLKKVAAKQRRVLVLDCCFSEAAANAVGAMRPVDQLNETVAEAAVNDLRRENDEPEFGTLLFCSSPRSKVSIGIPTAERTLFTGALLEVLREGMTRKVEMLSFSDLLEGVFAKMKGKYGEDPPPPRPALHQPDQRCGDMLALPAFPNVMFYRRPQKQSSGPAPLVPIGESGSTKGSRRKEFNRLIGELKDQLTRAESVFDLDAGFTDVAAGQTLKEARIVGAEYLLRLFVQKLVFASTKMHLCTAGSANAWVCHATRQRNGQFAPHFLRSGEREGHFDLSQLVFKDETVVRYRTNVISYDADRVKRLSVAAETVVQGAFYFEAIPREDEDGGFNSRVEADLGITHIAGIPLYRTDDLKPFRKEDLEGAPLVITVDFRFPQPPTEADMLEIEGAAARLSELIDIFRRDWKGTKTLHPAPPLAQSG
jgi:hypothetical protein